MRYICSWKYAMCRHTQEGIQNPNPWVFFVKQVNSIQFTGEKNFTWKECDIFSNAIFHFILDENSLWRLLEVFSSPCTYTFFSTWWKKYRVQNALEIFSFRWKCILGFKAFKDSSSRVWPKIAIFFFASNENVTLQKKILKLPKNFVLNHREAK